MDFRDGVIVIDKPEGWTSQDVCSKLRHRLHIRKIGHTGTLDPMATGVLPVCTGKATRMIEYYDLDMKSYHAEMQLGIVTDTLDVTGTILEQHGFETVTEDTVRKAFADYTGTVFQIPPKYSALMVNGRRAYDLARAGEEFELSKRQITITSNEVASIDLVKGRIEFDVTCSKGTYIRTICDDIGRTLGCGAAMTALRRTGSGCFKADEAIDISRLVEMTDEEISNIIIPVDKTLRNLGKIVLDDNRIIAFINGNTSARGFHITEETAMRSIYRIYGNNEFLGTGRIDRATLIPEKVVATR